MAESEHPRRRWTDKQPSPVNGRPTTADLLNVSNAVRSELKDMERRILGELQEIKAEAVKAWDEHSSVHSNRIIETDAIHQKLLGQAQTEAIAEAERRGQMGVLINTLRFVVDNWQFFLALALALLTFTGNITITFQPPSP